MSGITYNRKFTLDNGKLAEVDFQISHLSTADMELDVKAAWLFKDRNNSDAPGVELSDAERDRFEEEVALKIWDYVE